MERISALIMQCSYPKERRPTETMHLGSICENINVIRRRLTFGSAWTSTFSVVPWSPRVIQCPLLQV